MLSNQPKGHRWQESLHELESPPVTYAGRWAAGLLIGMLLSLALFAVALSYGGEGRHFRHNPFFDFTVIATALFGVAAGVSGAYALAFRREHSWLALASVGVGLAVMVMAALQLAD